MTQSNKNNNNSSSSSSNGNGGSGRRGGKAGRRSPAPESFVDGYLAALLARASDLISNEFHRVVQAHGFSVPEWRLLASLTDSEGLSVGRLAEIALAKQPTVTRLVDRMSARGLLDRVPHPVDRRKTVVRITPEGQAIIAGLIEQAKAHEHHVLEPFGHARADDLKTMLRDIIRLHGGEG